MTSSNRRPSTIRTLVAIAVAAALAMTFVSEPAGASPDHRSIGAVKPPKARKKKAAPTTTVPQIPGTINVFAAASLTEAFQEESGWFRLIYARTATINFNFGSSTALATQIQQGAPADVYASADEANVRKLSASNSLASDPLIFAHNRLAILVGEGNPKHITQLSDLARPDVKISLCAETVPCGKFAKQIVADAKVTLTPVSFEADVKGVVTKVSLGEVDAGITYVTDALATPSTTDGVRIPDENNVINAYPVAIPKSVQNDRLARSFALFLFTPLGQLIMRKHGFLPL